MDENSITDEIIGAAIEVHRHLGPGLLESVYRDCLWHELGLRGLAAEKEVAFPVRYKEKEISSGYRVDLLVQRSVIVELKAVETLLPIFTSQLLSYLRMSGLKLGLLINFNVAQLKDGVRRVVNNF
ncbi:MAG: GxxExxY protein [Sulfuricaulis sp.]